MPARVARNSKVSVFKHSYAVCVRCPFLSKETIIDQVQTMESTFKFITAKYFQEVLSSSDISDEENGDFVLILQPYIDSITDKDGKIKIQENKCFSHLLDVNKQEFFKDGSQIKIQL